MTADEIQSDIAARIAALVRGWHLVGLDGATLEVPMTAENVAEMFKQPSWLREQVEGFLFNRVNFAPRSSKI